MSRVATVLLALLLLVTSGALAATPKPWQWTPAQATSAVRAQGDEITGARLLSVTCRGAGKGVAGRWVAFRCRAAFTGESVGDPATRRTLVARTRRAGGLCFTTGSVVPAGCLAPGPRAKGSSSEVARTVYRQFGPPPQVFSVAAHGAGFYTWTWVSGEVTRRGSVTFTPSGAKLKVLP